MSSSAVSRRFVAFPLDAEVVSHLLEAARLGELDLRGVIAIDGIVFRDHTILIALGVTSHSAEKVILGVHEGSDRERRCRQGAVAGI